MVGSWTVLSVHENETTETCTTYAHEDLEVVVNHPLQSSESSNHDNSDRQPVPEASESDVFIDTAHRGTESLTGLTTGVELADHNVGRVRDNGAKNTGKIASGKRNSGLGSLSVVLLGSWKPVVYGFDYRFERSELHHGIRNLTTPERVQTLVETATWSVKSILELRLFVSHPPTPSLPMIVLIPFRVPVNWGGIVVCMRTLTASKGQRAMSAKNSAEALAVR